MIPTRKAGVPAPATAKRWPDAAASGGPVLIADIEERERIAAEEAGGEVRAHVCERMYACMCSVM